MIFSLGGWSPQIPTGFHVSCGTQELARLFNISGTGLSPPMVRLSRRFSYVSKSTSPALQPLASEEDQVWAIPLSLAATKGVSVDFLSSGYLDVSVLRVVLNWPINSASD